jgi:hypothetical protein
VAGSDGLRGLLARLYVVRAAAEASGAFVAPGSIREVADRVRRTPAREIERLRRLDVLRGGRLDETHPPLFDREHVATTLMQRTAQIVLSGATNDAIDRELGLMP